MIQMLRTGKINIPDGKKVAVALTYDCDTLTLWTGSVGRTDQLSLSRGEYGIACGIPRILDMLEREKIHATFFMPGKIAETVPDLVLAMKEAGHEIGYHGYAHVSNSVMSYDQELSAMDKGLNALAKLGVYPKGYRAPSADYSPQTIELLEKFGFEYASNLIGGDIYPYYPRKITGNIEKGNQFGETSSILEMPLSWALDDIVFVETITQFPYMPLNYLHPTKEHLERWKAVYDYTARFGNGELISVNHPQASGHPEFILNMERFIHYCKEHDAWFTNCHGIYEHFVPDAEEEVQA